MTDREPVPPRREKRNPAMRATVCADYGGELRTLIWFTEKHRTATRIYEAMHALGINAAAILEAIREVHAKVANWFCTDAGITLMFHDSEIMRAILSDMMSLGIPGLPVHDSIRVQEHHERQVYSLMHAKKNAYFSARQLVA